MGAKPESPWRNRFTWELNWLPFAMSRDSTVGTSGDSTDMDTYLQPFRYNAADIMAGTRADSPVVISSTALDES